MHIYNPYNKLILNIWRANMDITRIIGDPFAAVSKIALYTSETEKTENLREIVQKLCSLSKEDSISSRVRKQYCPLIIVDILGRRRLLQIYWDIQSGIVRRK